MPFSAEEIRIIKNHIPTCKKNCEVFLSVFDGETQTPLEKFEYLIDLVITMRKSLKDVKDILEAQLQ